MPSQQVESSPGEGAWRELEDLALQTHPTDSSQEVLLGALLSPPKERDSWRAWFHCAIRRRSLREGRTAANRRFREQLAARPECTWQDRSELERREFELVLSRALKGLDRGAKAVLRAHYWEGVSLSVYAERLGCDLGVVKRRHVAALELLRQRIGDPKAQRRDWAALGLALSAAAGTLLCVVLTSQKGDSVAVAMTALTPAQGVSRTGRQMVKLTASQTIELESELLQESIPVTRLRPATLITPQILAEEFELDVVFGSLN